MQQHVTQNFTLVWGCDARLNHYNLYGESRLQISSLSAAIFSFLTKEGLYHDKFAAPSHPVHNGGFSERHLQLHIRPLGVSHVHSVLSHISLTRHVSAITTLFATKSGGSFLMSTGFVDLQPSLSTKQQRMWSASRSLPRADSTVPSSSLYATVRKWSLVYPIL